MSVGVRIRKLAASTLIVLITTIVAFEVCSATAIEVGLLPIGYRPLFWGRMSDLPPADDWRTEWLPWGAWHKASSKSRQREACFDVVYSSNSLGMRDDEVNNETNRTKVFGLGDSFSEGYGSSKQDRFDTYLENAGYDYLNFGAAGNFGPVQYWLVYEHFARSVRHDSVVILFLPDNDFTDNDPEYWKNSKMEYGIRYRPYYRPSGDGYEIFYTTDRPLSEVTFSDNYFRQRDGLSALGKLLRFYTYSFGAYKYAVSLLANRSGRPYSGYFDATPSEIDAARYFLGKIARLAGSLGKQVLIYQIPRLADVQRSKEEAQLSSSTEMLRTLASIEPNVTFIDGLERLNDLRADIRDHHLSCDGHWNAEGNKFAADGLREGLLKMGQAPKF